MKELEKLLENLEGFAIYGADEGDLLERIARYVGDCRRLAVLGRDLGASLSKFCTGFEVIEGEPGVGALRRAVVELGRSLLMRWRAPVDGVRALVLVLSTQRNRRILTRMG